MKYNDIINTILIMSIINMCVCVWLMANTMAINTIQYYDL